jgi:hypothetical protein
MAHLEFTSNDLPHLCDTHCIPVYKYTPSRVCCRYFGWTRTQQSMKAKTLCHISQNYFEISSRRNMIHSSSEELRSRAWKIGYEYLRVVLRGDCALKRSWKRLRKKWKECVEQEYTWLAVSWNGGEHSLYSLLMLLRRWASMRLSGHEGRKKKLRIACIFIIRNLRISTSISLFILLNVYI